MNLVNIKSKVLDKSSVDSISMTKQVQETVQANYSIKNSLTLITTIFKFLVKFAKTKFDSLSF